MMWKRNNSIILFLLILMGVLWFITRGDQENISVTVSPASGSHTLFPHQCVDTMKVSRDRARLLATHSSADGIITSHLKTITSLGADCIAIGTPYDEEFQPYMRKWVEEARKYNLSVWFRGNWSAWEGWFDYETDMSPQEHTAATVSFIERHGDLFKDGDIFSASVEPENGVPFRGLHGNEKDTAIRDFLKREQEAVKNAFTRNSKEVSTEWISMSGGVAKTVLDDDTIRALNNTVTLDHYVASPEGMREYIDHFHIPTDATIVLGEFGAPIPDINGSMTESEQADFVDEILWELFLQRKIIGGVNYWTLTESSTAILDESGRQKQVGETLKKYYQPGKVMIKTSDTRRKPMKNIKILLNDHVIETTDEQGSATLYVPIGNYTLKLITPTGNSQSTPLSITREEDITVTASFRNN